MDGVGEEGGSRPRIRPTDDPNGFDTLNGKRVPKKRGLQEAGAGADVVAMGEAALPCRTTASKHDNNMKKTIGVLWEFMCQGWFFCCQAARHFLLGIIHILEHGSTRLATTMMQNTSMQILSVFFVVLSWTDIKYALGQTDYGCNMLVDPVAGKTSSNSFMVAILASITIGAVGVAYWIYSHRRKSFSMKVVDEVLKAGPPRMVRSDPDLALPPAIEPWSGME